jgi:hypothetical protein
MDWDDVPTGNDPYSGESGLQYCPECNEAEQIEGYDPAKAIIRDKRIAAEAAETYGS